MLNSDITNNIQRRWTNVLISFLVGDLLMELIFIRNDAIRKTNWKLHPFRKNRKSKWYNYIQNSKQTPISGKYIAQINEFSVI